MFQSQSPLAVDIDYYITLFDVLLIKSSNYSKNVEHCYAYDFSRADSVYILEYRANYDKLSLRC